MNELTDDARLRRIAAGLETVGRSIFQRLFLEDKILKLVDRRDSLKGKTDVTSRWMGAAIQEAILSMGALLRCSYPRIETKGD